MSPGQSKEGGEEGEMKSEEYQGSNRKPFTKERSQRPSKGP